MKLFAFQLKRANLTLIAAIVALWTMPPTPAQSQPIDVMTATGTFTGGGITLTADDLRRFAAEHAAHCAAVAMNPLGSKTDNANASNTNAPQIGNGPAPRGGGIGNVLIVECNGLFGYDTIQGAIEAAVDGDVVVVLPNDCTPEGRWFENIDFLGKAIRVQSANPNVPAVVEATVIDGNAEDTVVKFVNDENNDAVLDGVTIRNGLSPSGSGGGAIAALAGASPAIYRCVIRDNPVQTGSGIRIIGSFALVVENCRFINNSASVISASHSAHPKFLNCLFAENHGALFSLTTTICSEESCESILGCMFVNNVNAVITINDVTFRDCEFVENVGFLILGSLLQLKACNFEANCGLEIRGARQFISQSSFIGNQSSFSLLDIGIDTRITQCQFLYNESQNANLVAVSNRCQIDDTIFDHNHGKLGQIFSPTLRETIIHSCSFFHNTSLIGGGAIFVSAASPVVPGIIRNCEFVSNATGENGGAINLRNGTIHGCTFLANTAGGIGGAITSTNAKIENCTIVGNYADDFAGGVAGGNISNSILYNNRDSYGEGTSAQYVQGTTATYSNIQNLQYDFTPGGIPNAEAGNFDAVPMFVDPGSWDDGGTPDDYTDDVFTPGDYHLLPDSPCIDTGDPEFVPLDGATDIDGEPRLMGCRVDLGVDEFTQDEITLGDFDGDGAVTVADIPLFVQSTLGFTESGACIGDVNGDGRNDGRDVSDLVALLIAG